MTTHISLPPLPLDKKPNSDTHTPTAMTPSAPIAIPITIPIGIPSAAFETPSSSPPLPFSSASNGTIPLGSPRSLGRRRLDSFHIVTLIGRGGFGKVFLVKHKLTNQIYAMKVMEKESLIEKKAVDDAHSERNILAMLGEYNTPFIIKLHIAFETKRRIYLVMDFASGGELMYHLKKEYLLNEQDCKFYAAELLIALKTLHEKHIIHRDIKPENVLLDNNGHLVLTDFGLAKKLSGLKTIEDENHSHIGTEDYMAPEIISNKKHSGIPADYWAYGIFIYDCLCGHPPFSFPKEKGRTNKKRLFDRILKMKPKLPQFLSPEAHNLIKKLLTKDIRKRLCDPKEIQSHPWFASINWNSLINKELKPPIIPPSSSPTACFSPSLTKSTFSVPHSPLDSCFLSNMQQHQQNKQQCTGNVWQGFSFVAPGMEVHFELAPPAVGDMDKASASSKKLTPIIMGASPEVESMLRKSIHESMRITASTENGKHSNSQHGEDQGINEDGMNDEDDGNEDDEDMDDDENHQLQLDEEILQAEMAQFSLEAKEAVEIFEN